MFLTLKRKNKKGFTLIELIVVVAILAILAAVAVPSFVGLSDRAKNGVEIANASSLAGAINVYNAMNVGATIPAGGGHPSDATVTTLGTLAPQFDTTVNKANVYARVTVTNGIAIVSDTTLTATH